MTRGTPTPKAIVAVHELDTWKLAHGIVLPETTLAGYQCIVVVAWDA